MEEYIVEEKSLKNKNKKIIIIILSIVFLLIISVISYRYLSYNKIYSNIYINNMYVGNMTKDEAKIFLEQEFLDKYKGKEIVFKNDKLIEKEKVSNLISKLNLDESIELAYNQGREGNIFKRLIDGINSRFNQINIPIKYEFDDYNISKIGEKFGVDIKNRATQTSYEVKNEKLIVKMGKSGNDVDIESLKNDIDSQIQSFEFDTVKVKIIKIIPAPLNIDEVYEKVYTEPVDASYEINNNKLDITKEIVGKTFDKDLYKQEVSELKELQQLEIELEITYPNITEESINNDLFGEKLSSYSTKYNSGDVNRSQNIKLASEKINNIVLKSGDVFSYNDIVGERTEQAGFKKAHVYLNGKIVDGYGGGICQVSSTLYNAVLLADLEIVSRTNHMFTVGYVPLSRDATVSFGTVDFKFKNNTKKPLKITIINNGGRITTEIFGIQENKNRTIEIENEILSSTAPKVTIIEEVGKPANYQKVTQSGQIGYKSRAYKIIKENGVEVNRVLLSTDTYSSLDKVIVKGKQEQIQIEPQPQVEPIIPEVQIPIDTTENISSSQLEEIITDNNLEEFNMNENTIMLEN